MVCGHFCVISPMSNSVKVIDKEHLNQSGAKITTYYYQLFTYHFGDKNHELAMGYTRNPQWCALLTPEGRENVKIYKQSLLCKEPGTCNATRLCKEQSTCNATLGCHHPRNIFYQLMAVTYSRGAYSFSALEVPTDRYGTVVQASLLCRQLFNIVQ